MGVTRVKSRSTAGMARDMQLTRSARLAGEAFAFADHGTEAARVRGPALGALEWIFIAAAAAAGIYLGL